MMGKLIDVIHQTVILAAAPLLIYGVVLLAPAAAQQPAKVHLDLTQDQLTVVLQGLGELKWKDVLPTYMAIVQQVLPAQGTPPTAPPTPPAAVDLGKPAPIPAPPGDAHLLPLAPGTKSDLAPDTK